MKESVRLGRIAGVEVGFNWSLLVIAVLLVLGLGGSRFPVDAPGYSRGAYTVAGIVTALAFLGGVLVHEMSHALVARREGLEVDGIVLWLMGGYTRISETPKSPGAELRISAAGPLVSLLIGVVCVAAATLARASGVSHLTVSVLTWLGTINVLLAAFNLLPGSPLDGGRITHAAVWWRTGDRFRATRVASRAGWVIGAGLVVLGLLSAFGQVAGIDGLWLAIVGGFLMMASRAEGGASEVLESLDGLRAREVMVSPGVGPGWLTVDAFLREYTAPGPDGSRPAAFLAEQWGGGLVGLVPTGALDTVPPMYRFQVRTSQLAVPMAQLPAFSPDTPAGEMVTQMDVRRAGWALVVDSGRIVGVVSQEGVAAAAQRPRRPAAVHSSSWSLTRG